MKKKSARLSKKSLVAAIGASTIIGLMALQSILSNTAYTVTRVIDGDTFETKEKQIVRISGIQAPEKGLCGAEESTRILEKIILNKKVYIKTSWLDRFRRMIAAVYLVDGTTAAAHMVQRGMAIPLNSGSDFDKQLLALGEEARKKEVGLYGLPCTQKSNTVHPTCTIKGNVRFGKDEKIYHYPGCGQYNNVDVQLYLGDQWFCTEKEAQKAGFRKADLCPPSQKR